MTRPDIAGEAEALIRTLRGVTHVRIRASETGIDSIRVTAADDSAARHMAAHVRSALLAGLAAPVTPGRIHVDVAEDMARTADPGPTTRTTPRDRIRLLHDEHAFADSVPAGIAATAPRSDDATATTRPGSDDEPAEPPVTARPRLVSVDASRPGDGRVVCRVAIAFHTRVHRAEAVAVDLPGAAAQAAAQAAVRALIDAGLHGLELSGLREVEIAGREYVLVALRRAEPYARTRSGSAPIIGSAERSAAEATVDAARDMT